MSSIERPTRLTNAGFEYTYKDTHCGRFRYRCSHYRMGCKAALSISHASGEITMMNHEHSCTPVVVNQSLGNSAPVNVSSEYIDEAIRVSLSQQGVTASRVWSTVDQMITARHSAMPIVKPTKRAVIAAISRVRREQGSGDLFEKIYRPQYYYLTEHCKRRFLQIVMKYPLPSDSLSSQPHQLLLWSHPELLVMLRRESTKLFIDGTFYCVPKPFIQCVIILLYDAETDLFMPVSFALVDSKAQWTYWHLLHFLFVFTECKLDPKSVTCDFEVALFKAIREQFPTTNIIGCKFHFKQAIRRKLQEIGFDVHTISKLMREGMLDRLQNCTENQIDIVLQKLGTEINSEMTEFWGKFCEYFYDI
jgi:hypothetical protein